MAPDDHKQRSGNSSNGSGSSKSSKKQKPKKVPQRGLGVAQLEKIRLEEQQKKDVALQSVLQNNSPILAPDFRQNTPSQTDLPSDLSNQNPVLFPKPLNLGQGSWGKLLNGEQILEGESYRCDQSGGFAFRPNANLIYGPVPVFQASNGIPRKGLFQKQNSSSSMVKVSSGASSSSEITHNHLEPPSNQSFYGKIITSSKWPEEEKTIGVKRPYPFSLENPPGPAFPCKFPPDHIQYPIFRSAESSSSGNGSIVHFETRKPLPREGPASLNIVPEMRREKAKEQIGDLNGDFLTLAPPKPPTPHPSPGLSESEPKLQENADGPNFYSFLTSSDALNGQAANATTSSSGEVAEKLDLNLKL